MVKILRVETCRFKRTKDTPWEYGVVVNEGAGPIIDMDGKVVPSEPVIWNWTPVSDSLLTVKFGEPPEKGRKR